MKEKFYDLMGIDPVEGVASRETLVGHGMADEAALVWE